MSSLPVQRGSSSLSGLAAGDSRTVVEFYRRHAGDVYRFIAHRIEGPPEDIEEILQDTMLAAIRGAARFRGDCSERTWLCGIARNQIAQRRRTDLRRKRIPPSRILSLDAPGMEGLPETCNECQDISQSLAARETVRQILGHLEDSYREVLVLRYVDEFSVKDIAMLWDKSERAIEGMLRRAREQARQIGEKYL